MCRLCETPHLQNLPAQADPGRIWSVHPVSVQKPSALKRDHPVLKNMKILDFFLFLWVIFALLDPDPDPATHINADPCGSGSETLPVGLVVYSTHMSELHELYR